MRMAYRTTWLLRIYARCMYSRFLSLILIRIITCLISQRWTTSTKSSYTTIVMSTLATEHALIMLVHWRHLSILLRSAIGVLSVNKINTRGFKRCSSISTFSFFAQQSCFFHLIFSFVSPFLNTHTCPLVAIFSWCHMLCVVNNSYR